MATQRDFYEVLGVSRSATQDEIKAAYRRLAREFHPDVNKSEDAPKKFAEVQQAYDVLSDEKSRRTYDQFGHAGVSGSGFAGAGAGAGGRGRRGTYTWTNVGGEAGINAEEMGSIFEELFGGGSGFAGGMGGQAPFGARARSRSRPMRSPDTTHDLHVDFLTAIRGGTETLRVRRGGGSQKIDVSIPPGTKDGAKLRIRGAGAPSTGGPPGDLILKVHVGLHPLFRRDGLNLVLDLPLTVSEAALGTSVSVPTPHGKTIKLTVPAGTSSGQRLRLKGHGVRLSDGQTGDLHAIVKIMVPKKPDAETKKLLEQLRPHLENPRSPDRWP